MAIKRVGEDQLITRRIIEYKGRRNNEDETLDGFRGEGDQNGEKGGDRNEGTDRKVGGGETAST